MSNALACRKQGKQALVAATIIQKSNMSKHTPGPWIFDGREVVDSHDNTIALVNALNQYNTTEGIVEEKMPWQANARLMAAAPELLEFVRYVAKGIPVWDDPCSLEESVDHLEERAKRLVAKIESDE